MLVWKYENKRKRGQGWLIKKNSKYNSSNMGPGTMKVSYKMVDNNSNHFNRYKHKQQQTTFTKLVWMKRPR